MTVATMETTSITIPKMEIPDQGDMINHWLSYEIIYNEEISGCADMMI